MELESLHRVGPSYNDPLNVLMNRFKNINAKVPSILNVIDFIYSHFIILI